MPKQVESASDTHLALSDTEVEAVPANNVPPGQGETVRPANPETSTGISGTAPLTVPRTEALAENIVTAQNDGVATVRSQGNAPVNLEPHGNTNATAGVTEPPNIAPRAPTPVQAEFAAGIPPATAPSRNPFAPQNHHGLQAYQPYQEQPYFNSTFVPYYGYPPVTGAHGSPYYPRATVPRVPLDTRPSGPMTPLAAYEVMRKWGLKFSGARHEDANTFISRIKEGRTLVNIHDKDVLHSIPFFLSGVAILWYRSKQSQWRTWADFETAWNLRFTNLELQFALRDEIRKRTQGEDESVADYLTYMRAYINMLNSSWQEKEQIDYAYRNLLPRFQLLIRREELHDLDMLEDLARRYENSFSVARGYVPPPTLDSSVCPELAYRGVRSDPKRTKDLSAVCSILDNSVTEMPSSVSAPNYGLEFREQTTASFANAIAAPRNPSIRDTSAVKCWNCQALGHVFHQCTTPRKKFCFGCGQADLTKSTCPRCSVKARANHR